jgi:hypothetical protein
MTRPDSPKKHEPIAGIGRHGEHPYGDLGQIIILLVFLAIWILDSFVFRYSTFLSASVPIYLRLIFAGMIPCSASPLSGITPVLFVPDRPDSILDLFACVYGHFYILQRHCRLRRKISGKKVRKGLQRLQEKSAEVDSPALIFFQVFGNLFNACCV